MSTQQFQGPVEMLDNVDIKGTWRTHKRLAKKLTATTTLSADDSGALMLIGPAGTGLADNATFTLPSAAAGLYFEFVYAGNAADAEDFVISTGADANFFIGGIVQHDTDDGGDDTVVYHPNGSSNSKVTVDKPDSGTKIELSCDGTNWVITGKVISATNTGVVFDDQS